MGIFSDDKPYTAISSLIDRNTADDYEVDDIACVPEISELCRMQAGGPTEAARALRKKLKYGSKHEQLRAVTLLDALSENAGSKFQREFGNEMLLERVRVLVQDQYVDVEVRRRLAAMILNWKALFEGQQGMEHLSNMYHALPKQAVKGATHDAGNHGDYDDDDDDDDDEAPPPRPMRPSTTGTRAPQPQPQRQPQRQQAPTRVIPLSQEMPRIQEALAEANRATTMLSNALLRVNTKVQLPSDIPEVVSWRDAARNARRRILRYIQMMQAEEWLATLLHANEELVAVLQKYEIMNRSLGDEDEDAASVAAAVATEPPSDSDSELDEPTPRRAPRGIAMPSRKQPTEDNPFGDDHIVGTPAIERNIDL